MIRTTRTELAGRPIITLAIGPGRDFDKKRGTNNSVLVQEQDSLT